jgi:hypothetical protein
LAQAQCPRWVRNGLQNGRRGIALDLDHCPRRLVSPNLRIIAAVLARGRNVQAPDIPLHLSARFGRDCLCERGLSTQRMCSGKLTNTREDGVTLGQCDLNFITVKQMDEIESICGIPGTIDTAAENQCRIRAVVSPDPISSSDHGKLYKVIEVWSVDKR